VRVIYLLLLLNLFLWVKHLVVLVHDQGEGAGRKEFGENVERDEKEAPQEEVVLLPLLDRVETLGANYKVYRA
jgi:hypothetical protein